MKAIFLILTVAAIYKSEKFIIGVRNLESGQYESLAGDYVFVNPPEPATQSASFQALLKYVKAIKKLTMLSITFESTGHPKTLQSVFLWNPADQTVGFSIQAGLNDNNDVISLNILKSDNKKTIDQIEYRVSDELQSQIYDSVTDKSKQRAGQTRPAPGQAKPGQDDVPATPEPEEQSFFKKYFWYIVIGGFLIMNIINSDKGKIQEAYTQAQQQAQAQANRR